MDTEWKVLITYTQMRSASLRGGAFYVLKHYIEQRAGTKTKLLVLSTAADITMLVQERQKFFKATKTVQILHLRKATNSCFKN